MTDTPRESVTVTTNLGPAVIKLPQGWKGGALTGNAFGEWVFDDPDDLYSLYIKTEREPPDGKGNAQKSIRTTPVAAHLAHRLTYRDVKFSTDNADRGCVMRAEFSDEDDNGECRHDERTRLIDANVYGLITLRFNLVGAAEFWETDDTRRLRHDLAQQLDLVTAQLMSQFGFDCASNPGLLWRGTVLDIQNGGKLAIRRPLGWALDPRDGHAPGVVLWHGESPDRRWEMELEHRGFVAERAVVEAECRKFEDMILAFARERLDLVGEPRLDRDKNGLVIEIAFRGDSPYRGEIVRRWYVIRQDDRTGALHRITFASEASDADTAPTLALKAFFKETALICRNNAPEVIERPEPVDEPAS
jgi:hypothetical protein